MKVPRHITIATGIYPPEIGGPAEYARELFEAFLTQKYDVSVVTYGSLRSLPTGLRHVCYFFKLILNAFETDYIIALDTFSAALPATLFAMLFGKKIIVRVAGDFVWESYVERTREKVLLSEFYTLDRKYTWKERVIFRATRFVFGHVSKIIFSTEWQRNIFLKPYNIDLARTSVVENFYPTPEISPLFPSSHKVFLSPSREKYIKNKELLNTVFAQVVSDHPEVSLDSQQVSHEVLVEKMSRVYAVIVPSFSEVSPNLILDARRFGLPTIVTRDTGIADRLAGQAVFVNPLSADSVKSAIEELLDPEKYMSYRKAIIENTYVHSWNDIAQECIDIYSHI